MPLWHIYHPPQVFPDAASKASLAKDITAIYTRLGMPAFYVNVLFHPTPGDTLFLGGVPQSLPSGETDATTLPRPFVRLVGEHIAWNSGADTAGMGRFCDKFDKVVKPHIADKGYDWEYHVDETPTEFWRIQGLRPPLLGSEEIKVWARENRAVTAEKL